VGIISLILHNILPAKFSPALFQILSGGLLFGAFFMATDPVTSPFTFEGKMIGEDCHLLGQRVSSFLSRLVIKPEDWELSLCKLQGPLGEIDIPKLSFTQGGFFCPRLEGKRLCLGFLQKEKQERSGLEVKNLLIRDLNGIEDFCL